MWRFANKLKAIVIDEISMVRADMMDNIDQFLRLNMEVDKPFGGVKLVMIGDVNQLSPVVEHDLTPIFTRAYRSPYFFDAKVFNEVNLINLSLTHIFRQKDPTFVRILNNVREGKLTNEDRHNLNKRVNVKLEGEYITLTTTNSDANAINVTKLAELKTEERIYKAEIEGTFSEKAFPTERILKLKVGAQVMMLRNGQGYCNGTICVVKELREKSVIVTITEDEDDSFDVLVSPVTFECIEYDVEDDENITHKEVGKFTQLPLKLAWA
jgi:hypothetical protein